MNVTWKHILVILALALALAGCATDKATNCRNAQFGYTLSVAMLEQVATMSPQLAAYWAAYKVGAQLALQTYCLEPPK